jgi:hypothetical protein
MIEALRYAPPVFWRGMAVVGAFSVALVAVCVALS